MTERLEILKAAVATQDPAKLYALVERALALAEGAEAQTLFGKRRVDKLTEQVKRQTVMIDNLEKSLWKK